MTREETVATIADALLDRYTVLPRSVQEQAADAARAVCQRWADQQAAMLRQSRWVAEHSLERHDIDERLVELERAGAA